MFSIILIAQSTCLSRFRDHCRSLYRIDCRSCYKMTFQTSKSPSKSQQRTLPFSADHKIKVRIGNKQHFSLIRNFRSPCSQHRFRQYKRQLLHYLKHNSFVPNIHGKNNHIRFFFCNSLNKIQQRRCNGKFLKRHRTELFFLCCQIMINKGTQRQNSQIHMVITGTCPNKQYFQQDASLIGFPVSSPSLENSV